MSRAPSGLAARALGYFAVRDLVPLYAVYALLFRDHGLSMGEVSSLLVIWSITSFVMEVPSGAWADSVSRRGLLVLSSLLYAIGFSLWLLVPGYAGFAAGFVLWGTSSALMSGTFEALLYDELAAVGAESSYAGLMGWANSLSMLAQLVGTLVAAPLFALGSYHLVGWVSVAIALGQAMLALSLPAAPRVAEADQTDVGGAPQARAGFAARYATMLRSGLSEVMWRPSLRHAVLIVSLLLGVLAFDEYFPFVAREHGAATATVPLLNALTVLGQMMGTALAGRTAGMRTRTMAWALTGAAALIAIGAAEGRWLGFLALGAGYGIASNAQVVAEARLQGAIEGPARATVTSAYGLLSECFAVTVFAAVALSSPWVAVSTMVMALTLPMVVVAALIPRWLPARCRTSAAHDAADSVADAGPHPDLPPPSGAG